MAPLERTGLNIILYYVCSKTIPVITLPYYTLVSHPQSKVLIRFLSFSLVIIYDAISYMICLACTLWDLHNVPISTKLDHNGFPMNYAYLWPLIWIRHTYII